MAQGLNNLGMVLQDAGAQAGAQSIVASLWRVDDEATRDFMATFHRALRRVGVAAALREAQITLLRDPSTAHPYYWGAFLLMGAR